jgi:HNH endonuclease
MASPAYSTSISRSLVFCFNLSSSMCTASNSMSQWHSGQWSQMIEDDQPESDIGDSKIHSIQNGLLLLQTVHSCFDKYMIAINPDVRVFTSTHKMILIFSRIITKSPVSLKTFLAMMVGTWSSKTVSHDISPFEISSNTIFAKLCYAT